MAGVGRGVYMVCGFAEDRTLVTGPSEKSACVLRGRRVCTINYFYTPVSRLSTRASGSARRATRARAGRGRRPAPPPPLCCLQRAARPAAPLYFIDVSLSHTVLLSRLLYSRSLAAVSRTPLGDALSRTPPAAVPRTRTRYRARLISHKNISDTIYAFTVYLINYPLGYLHST